MKELTLISIATIYKTNSQILKGQQGFSLLEILVAFTLAALVFVSIPFGETENDRKKINESLELIDRALRVGADEAILRNKIVRLKFDLESKPVEYVIEYGQAENLILSEPKDTSRMSLRDREREAKKIKKMDSQFVPISEFEEELKTLPEDVEISAVGTTYYPTVIDAGHASIYFYPNGEKDTAIIFLNTEIEMATLKTSPFENKTYEEYHVFSDAELATFDTSIEDKINDLYGKWVKQ